jgi:hypothetical protein
MEQRIHELESRRGHKIAKEGDGGVPFSLIKRKVILMENAFSSRLMKCFKGPLDIALIG